MQGSEFVGKVFTKFKGKAKSKAPASGSAKFTMYLDIASEKIRDWVEDTEVEKRTVRRAEDIAIVSGAVALPSDYASLADSEVYAGGDKLTVVDYLDRNADIDAVYEDGNWLRLTKPDSHVGQNLQFSIIFYPPDLVDGNSTVVCDSINWLVTATAAAIAFNDPQKQDSAPDLEGFAGVQYKRMAKRARRKPKGTTTRISTTQPRIGRTW